jgi:hypothetical protein
VRQSARLTITADPLRRSDTTEVAEPTMRPARTESGATVDDTGDVVAGCASCRGRWTAPPASAALASTSAEVKSAGPVDRNQAERGNSTAMPVSMDRVDKVKGEVIARTTPVFPTMDADTDTRLLTLPNPSAARTEVAVSTPNSNVAATDLERIKGNPQSSMLSTLPKKYRGKCRLCQPFFERSIHARKVAHGPP